MHKVLFFVEGFTDIRFVTGLSEICTLTLCVPARAYRESGLKERVAASGIQLEVHEIDGSRLAFQARSMAWLWDHARDFDVIISQEVLRGSFNATVAGWLRGRPVITYMGIAPLEYFRCRRERGRIGPLSAFVGESAIRTLMTVNGRLATKCLAMGPYLRDIASQYCPRSDIGLYYGVDTEAFRPAGDDERQSLRRRRDLPTDKFIIFLSSRISHEKDPETVLRAVALARRRGLDAIVINLGGGFREFLDLARELDLPDPGAWVLGRPAAHPVTEVSDYFRAADALALASLAEGAAYSTLEALACGTPVVATRVGGMAVQLEGVAQLTPRRDFEAMAEAFLRIAADPAGARAQALRGREMVEREWSRTKAFRDLAVIIDTVAARPEPRAA